MCIRDSFVPLCGLLYSVQREPIQCVAMQVITKLSRRLPGSLVLLITVCVAAQQITQQQPTQRPRRVNGSEQTTEAKKTPPASASEEVDEGDVVRVETQLVSVPAVVTDSSGRPLSGLKPENFRLIEDGQVQTITNFGTSETPFEIALLLDTSGSTRDDVALIRSAANSFIQALRAGDRVGIVAFNQAQTGAEAVATVEVLTQLTSDREALRSAIE